MNKVDLIWDSWDHISIKQSHNYKLNFEVKITWIFNSIFYHIHQTLNFCALDFCATYIWRTQFAQKSRVWVKVFKFLNYLFWMKCPYILNVNLLPRFFWYTYYSSHTSQLKYVESIWMTLYYLGSSNEKKFFLSFRFW